MEFKKLIQTGMILGAMGFGATTVNAQSWYMNDLNVSLGSNFSCNACHAAAGGGGDKGVTALAATWTANKMSFAMGSGLTAAQQTTLANADSDNDGVSNIKEVAAGTDPGTTPLGGNGGTTSNNGATTDTSSGGGCIASSATTPLMMVLAMLTLGFFVRRKKD